MAHRSPLFPVTQVPSVPGDTCPWLPQSRVGTLQTQPCVPSTWGWHLQAGRAWGHLRDLQEDPGPEFPLGLPRSSPRLLQLSWAFLCGVLRHCHLSVLWTDWAQRFCHLLIAPNLQSPSVLWLEEGVDRRDGTPGRAQLSTAPAAQGSSQDSSSVQGISIQSQRCAQSWPASLGSSF